MKKIILFILIFALFSIKVNAVTLYPTGDNTGIRGKNISIYLTLDKELEEVNISAIDGKINYDNNIFELISYTNLMEEWFEFSGIKNNFKFAFANLKYNNLIVSSTKNIIKIDFKIKNNAKSGDSIIKVLNPEATNELGNGVKIDGGSHTVKILSDTNDLSNIIIDGREIDFDETILEYNLKTHNSKINIIGIPKDNKSSISGDIGEKELEYGINKFIIKVTSESGINKTYKINIDRIDNRSADCSLSNIKLSTGSLKYQKDKINYNIEVEYNITEITIDATLSDNKANFTENYGPRIVNLNLGNNAVILKVVAENGLTRTYTINIFRKKEIINTTTKVSTEVTTTTKVATEPVTTNTTTTETTTSQKQTTTKEATTKNNSQKRSSNNYLSEIYVNDELIIFNKEEYSHKINLPYNVETANIKVNTEDEKATFTIEGNNNLIFGDNVFLIKVEAEDKTIRIYELIITKKEENKILSNNSKLKELIISGHKIKFNKDTYDYTVKITDEKELDILYKQDDKNSSVIISGNNNIKSNDIIRITVKAEDNTYTEYRIKIEKNTKFYDLTIIILTIVSLGIIILCICLYYNKIKEEIKIKKTS